jgi:hypothetical protein
VESRVSQVHASAVVRLRSALKDLAAPSAFDTAQKENLTLPGAYGLTAQPGIDPGRALRERPID